MNRLIHGLSFEQYRALEGLSISSLKVLGASPLKYRHHLGAERTETAAMAFGTACHTAILEPKKFATDFVLWEGGVRRGKEWDRFRELHAGQRILTFDEFETVLLMRAAVRAHSPALRYLEAGEAEVSMQWVDPVGGRACRGRADWFTTIDGRPVIVDLKTARSVKDRVFGSQAARLGYHLQFAYYHDGFKAITGEEPRVVVIAVESTEPHEVGVFNVPEDVLLQGREEYMRLLDILDTCEQSGHWPPALEEEVDLSLPSWVYGSESGDDLSGLGLIA